MRSLNQSQIYKMKINAGLIGTGHLGKLHLKMLKEISAVDSNISIAGVYDIDTEKGKAAASEYEVKLYNDIESLIRDSNAVIIVTPTSTHFSIASQAANAGKNIFIEKPVTETVEESQKLLSLIKDKKIKVQVGHIERFNPAVLAVEQFNLQPLFIETHRLAQFNPRGTDVSVIQDLMIHDIDIILNLVKSPVESIDANGVAIITDKIDIANARIKFENGCVVNVTASRISQSKMRKMRIFQKNAYISIDFQQNSSEIFRLMNDEEFGKAGLTEGEYATFSLGERKLVYQQAATEEINPLKYELKSFFDSIIDDTEPLVTLEDGKQALEVASKIIEEAENSLKKMKV